MIAEWRGGNLATMRSINCRSDSASICSRGSISISGTGVGGLARGWDLAEEPEPADFFLDSAMLLKVNSIESFATGRRNKYFRTAAKPDQRGEMPYRKCSTVTEKSLISCRCSGADASATLQHHKNSMPR